MGRKRGYIIRRPGSPNWYQNFTINGHRFRDCLGTDDKETAEILVAKIRSDALLGKLTGKKPEISLTQALGRYWLERGQHAATSDELSELTVGILSNYVASRRVRKERDPKTRKWRIADRANASINREIGHLRTAILAARGWGVSTPEIEWRRLFLDEPENVQTILTEEKEEALFSVLRPDYHPLVQFALLTGLRLGNAIGLTWDQVDWDARMITFRTKSRKPGGALHVLPLTGGIAAILSRERGNHPRYVFTYLCDRNRHDPKWGQLQEKGRRYPFTQNGWRKEWESARQAIGLPQLRFHDLRHTAATRALLAHRNLKTVQRMLGHADLTTMLRYTASDVSDVRAAMEAVEAQSRHKIVPAAEIRKQNQRD